MLSLLIAFNPVPIPTHYYYPPVCEINMCVTTSYTEQIISWLNDQKWLVYRPWCNMQKPCRPNAYDCSWLIDAARRHVWFYDGRKLNAWAVFQAGEKIKVSDVQRWDYMFMQNMEWWPNHLAIVSQPRDGKWVYIIDAVEYDHKVSERFIFVGKSQRLWSKYKIHFVRIDYDKDVIMDRRTWRYYQG